MKNIPSNILKQLVLFLLVFYKKTISPLMIVLFGGSGCRFNPTCSVYSKESIEKFGFTKGLKLTFERLKKCHPYSQSYHYDPVPNKLV